ncbi:hypothetical protein AB0G86_41205 [Streptomyces scabiei]|uniref:hypothetical protein n=1 Tax=Streptomyces scabiei TaxID=1930 RepID=UPI0033C7854A
MAKHHPALAPDAGTNAYVTNDEGSADAVQLPPRPRNPREACTQDAGAEEIDASTGRHDETSDSDRQGPTDTYEVTVIRTEVILYTLPAASARHAEERYLMEGEETGSETVELRVDSIEQVSQST